ncbi:hypothetical protein F5Y05DRAFT_408071 [Hypoxylon sp. FL0543]|nr:hypothetical protein F5Y05DRAFT_408071 [Hypoxylon sp. FL0543]
MTNPAFNWKIDPADYEDAESARLADEVSKYFVSRRLKYLDVAGIGGHGGALVLREDDENGRPIRKIVVKYSVSEEADQDLRTEAQCLELLRGAEHIVQMIPLAQTDLNISGTGKRPTLALEFVPHGTARAFLQKLQRNGTRLPSRMLWSILLCLSRQLTAMAYPPQGEENAPVSPELLKPTERPLGLTQNSCHLANLLIGDLSPESWEHFFVPIFKLIDFGRGLVHPNVLSAMEANIYGAGFMIMSLAAPEIPAEYHFGDWRGTENWYDPKATPDAIYPVTTCAHEAFLQRQDLDPLLQDIIVRMLSRLHDDKPNIFELVHTCEWAVAYRRLEDFDNDGLDAAAKHRESDEWIREFIRSTILDADVIGGPLEHERKIQDSQLGTTLTGGMYKNIGQTITFVNRTDGATKHETAAAEEPTQTHESDVD